MEPQQRGTATLLAEARELDTAAGDDALDLLEHAPGRPARPRRPGGTRERLRVLPGLDLAGHGSSTALSKYCSTRRPAACRWGDTIGGTVSREQVAGAVSADRLC